MSSEDARARPSQVTVAGWTVVAASVIVVLAVFQEMGNLNSVDMREQVTRALSEGTGSGLGISVDTALEAIRWSLYVAGVASVITGILGVYVLRRDTVARIVLTVAAVPIVITSPVAGAFPGMIVGAGAALLWTRPARDWFAGRPVTPSRPGTLFGPRREPEARAGARPEPPRRDLPPDLRGPAGDQQPPPTRAWGAPTGRPVEPHWAPPVGPPVRLAPTMPRQVRVACILTWVGTAISAAGALVLLIVVLAAEQTLVDAVVEDSRWDASLDTDLIAPVMIVFSVVVIAWCALNAVLAWFVWNRHRGAWTALTVSVGLAAVVSVIGFPPSLAHLAALAGTLGLLTSAPTRAWFRR